MSVTQILVVDDYLPWQRFVSELFESQLDFKIVSIASDGWEAVQKATELQPDVILMDGSLPGISGFEATRHIRALSPASKILFLSEHRGADLVRAAFEVGASGYVLKSDSNADLIPGVRAVLLDHRFVSHSLTCWRDSLSLTD
jgi:DNA-binding NarL/FixJ family response regulator